jgi:hypothetical protein
MASTTFTITFKSGAQDTVQGTELIDEEGDKITVKNGREIVATFAWADVSGWSKKSKAKVAAYRE